MKKQLWLVLVVMLVALLVVFAACGTPTDPGPSDPGPSDPGTSDPGTSDPGDGGLEMTPTKWSFACYLDSASIHYVHQKSFCDAVRERTDGLLDIQIYAAGELPFDGYEFIQMTSDRTVEMSAPGFGYFDNESVASGVAGWPMLATSNDQLLTAIDAMSGILAEELSSYGVENLGIWSMMGNGWYGKGNTPQQWADLSGKKIRVHDVNLYEIMTPFGIEPVSITWAEVIPSMQRGVCDGAMTGCIAAYDSAWYEIVDWAFQMNCAGSAGFILINQQALAELPAEVQQIVREEALNMQKLSIDFNEANTIEYFEKMGEHGVDLVYCSDADYKAIEEIAVPLWDKLAAERGPVAQEALALIREALDK